MSRVLAIGAHPDVYELGAGGTLRRHILSGHEVRYLIMTRGQGGNHTIDREEGLNSARVLGIEGDWLDFEDTCVPEGKETIEAIEKIVKEFQPHVVYTHTENDRHQDHRAVAKASVVATRFVPTVLHYESPSTNTTFGPSYFSDISKTINNKLDALASYRTQIEKGVVDLDWVKNQGRYWAFKARCRPKIIGDYVEAFTVGKILV